jgi:hypothetical protein
MKAHCLLQFAVSLATTASAQSVIPPPVLREAPFSDSELKQVLAVLCPGHDYVGADKSGCRVCPEGTMDAGLDAGSGGTVDDTIAGHLLTPISNDVLLVMRGCEPHANGFVDSMLFTKADGKWSLEGNFGGGAIGECRKIPNREGRDGLLCRIGDYHMGLMDSRLSFGYVTGSGISGDELIATILVTSSCDPPQGMSTMIQSEIKKEEWIDAAGTRTLNLTATCIRYRRDCKRKSPPAAPARTFHIRYAFDGESLTLTPASVAEKRAYDACSKLEEDPPPAPRPAAKKKP